MNRATRRRSGIKTEALKLDIGIKDNRVTVVFSAKLKWFSMGTEETKILIKNLQDNLNKLEGEKS